MACHMTTQIIIYLLLSSDKHIEREREKKHDTDHRSRTKRIAQDVVFTRVKDESTTWPLQCSEKEASKVDQAGFIVCSVYTVSQTTQQLINSLD